MRQARACLRCRQLKKKCMSDSSTSSCSNCMLKSVVCSFEARNRSRLAPAPAQRMPSEPERVIAGRCLISDECASRLVELYIYYIHDRPHSLFHLSSLRQSVLEQTIPLHLLYALCAMGCRFSSNLGERQLESSLMAAAKQTALECISDVNIELIQSLILQANLYAAHSDPITETLLFSQ